MSNQITIETHTESVKITQIYNINLVLNREEKSDLWNMIEDKFKYCAEAYARDYNHGTQVEVQLKTSDEMKADAIKEVETAIKAYLLKIRPELEF